MTDRERQGLREIRRAVASRLRSTLSAAVLTATLVTPAVAQEPPSADSVISLGELIVSALLSGLAALLATIGAGVVARERLRQRSFLAQTPC